MTTFPPIQPRPILSKTPTINNTQYSSSPSFFMQSPSVANTNLYQTNADLNPNNSSIQTPSVFPIQSSPSEEFLKRLRDFQRGRQYVSFIYKKEVTYILFINF
jgi:hypothetical protein